MTALSDPSRRRPGLLVLGLVIGVVVTVIDQLVKEWVLEVLRPGVFVPFLGDGIGWQLVFNPGGAFGVPAPAWIFLTVTVIVVVVVVRLLPRASSAWQASGFGLLLAGALGNVIDRLIRPGDGNFGGGHVVDFVAWGSFPRFNVADAAITVGFVLLVATMLIDERRQARLAALGGSDADERPPGEHPAPDQ